MKILKPSYVKLLYQIGVILTQHQILVNDLQGNVLQLKERINNQLLGVQGLSFC